MAAALPRSTTSLADRMRNLATSQQPAIEVLLDGPAQPVRTFSTLDPIQGRVVVSAPVDTHCDRLEIALVGHVRSFVDKATTIAAANGRNEAFQQFLCLQQPLDASPRALSAGQPLTLPFNFVVPEHLLPRSCSHKCNNPKIKHCHLQLPPSLGDAELAGYGSTLLDDLAPSMAQISYGVRVRLFRNRQRDGKEMILAAHTCKIRVIPGVEEQPPVTFDARDDEYCLRKERSIRKGLLKARTGRIAVETAQPTSFRLPRPSECQGAPDVSTMATVHLRFDPIEPAAQPPKLNSLATKLKVVTFFASAPRRDFPVKSGAVYDSSQGLVFETLPLAHRCVSSVTWEKHDATEQGSRRDSVLSLAAAASFNVPPPTTMAAPGMPFYTAKLLVPLDLPKNKAIVPTFHSCLVSRVYTLELHLSIANVPGTSTLKVPVQVSCDSGNQAQASRRASETGLSARSSIEDDDYWGLRDSFDAAYLDADAPPVYSEGRVGA